MQTLPPETTLSVSALARRNRFTAFARKRAQEVREARRAAVTNPPETAAMPRFRTRKYR
jgi:hypothetical protein